jgi:hypothetical protein
MIQKRAFFAGAIGHHDPTSASCDKGTTVLHYWHMSHTITIRLTKDLAAWLEETAKTTGLSQGQIIRDQLERSRAAASGKAFMRLAGIVRGPKDLSTRKGFSRK